MEGVVGWLLLMVGVCLITPGINGHSICGVMLKIS